MKNYISVYIGVVAAISIFVLSIVFLYFNPYSDQTLTQETFITFFFMFLFPAFLAVIAAFIRKKIFMIVCNIWLLPGTLYLGVATIPSIWNLYIVFLIVYFLSIVWMKKG
ncbi:hypothetical protein [Bacillus sp. NP247]|nr:hypothetical protein [Bacillus sp. NP247]QWU45810.1 hypothetical protein KPL75_02340 [Bacillus sp. NP247]